MLAEQEEEVRDPNHLRRENAELRAEVAGFKKEIASLRRDMQNMQKIIESLQATIATEQATRKTLVDKTTSPNNDNYSSIPVISQREREEFPAMMPPIRGVSVRLLEATDQYSRAVVEPKMRKHKIREM